jgi:hypothetical protein
MLTKLILIFTSLNISVYSQIHTDEGKAYDKFTQALIKAETEYLEAIREEITKSTTVEILKLDPKIIGEIAFSPERDKIFSWGASEQQYKITGSKLINAPKDIQVLIKAIFPAVKKPFAMGIAAPEYAIRFRNLKGELIYQTTICIEGNYIQIEYPRYDSRLGIDVKLIKTILTKGDFKDPKTNSPKPTKMPNRVGGGF